MNLDLTGKLALVTGASRGIGKAIALQLGKQGATVVGTATSENGANAISAYFSEHGVQGKGLVVNVSEAPSVETLLASIESEFGKSADILVNNAGITRDNLLMRMKDDEWDDIIDTNLTPIFKLSKAHLRSMMKARWGRIISIGSVVGTMGNPGQSNYAAAKAGVIGFSKALAREVGSRGITVNVVSPGFIETDMTHALSDEQKEKLATQIPLARLGKAEDIASAVGFLASEAGAYITGETIHVNGGMNMV